MIFFALVTSRTYSIRLTANLRAQIDNGDTGLSFGCITILLASIIAIFIAIAIAIAIAIFISLYNCDFLRK